MFCVCRIFDDCAREPAKVKPGWQLGWQPGWRITLRGRVGPYTGWAVTRIQPSLLSIGLPNKMSLRSVAPLTWHTFPDKKCTGSIIREWFLPLSASIRPEFGKAGGGVAESLTV